MRSIYIAIIIFIIQGLISKIFRRKSWINQIDENLSEYEIRREGW